MFQDGKFGRHPFTDPLCKNAGLQDGGHRNATMHASVQNGGRAAALPVQAYSHNHLLQFVSAVFLMAHDDEPEPNGDCIRVDMI
jgi:hypothetical protein